MYFILFPWTILLCVGLARLARQVPLGLKSRWIHPFNLFGVLLFLTLLDFGFLLYDLSDAGYILSSGFRITRDGASKAFVYFGLWSTLAFGAIALAVRHGRRGKVRVARGSVQAAILVFALAAFACLLSARYVIQYSLSMGDLFYVATNRTTFFAENAVVFVAASLLIPAYIILGYHLELGKVVLAAAVAAILMLSLFGQRGDLIMVVIILAFLFSRRRGGLHAPVLYAALPVGGWLLTILGYSYRFSGQFSDLSQYVEAQGGWVGVLFRGNDVALAEAYTSVFSSAALLHRDWYESFLGAVVAFVPRELIPWKPYGASTHYTMVMDAQAWEVYRRELVIGGPVNMYLDFGFLFGAVMTAFLVYLWARMIVRGDRQGTGAFYGPIAILCLYAFGRNDMYSLGLVMWPLLAITLIYLAFSVVFSGPETRKARATMAYPKPRAARPRPGAPSQPAPERGP